MPLQHTSHTQKRAVNVAVDSDLIAAARELGIPLSATLEQALRERVSIGRAADSATILAALDLLFTGA